MNAEAQSPTDNFRLLLREEFVRRCHSNPRYSLRAYAKQMKVDQSLLSKLLNGKRQASPKVIEHVGHCLGWKPSKISTLLQTSSEPFDFIENDHFEVISEWYHFAILELLKTKGCKHDAQWLAGRLSLSSSEIESALERLSRLGYLRRGRKKWEVLSPNNTWANLAATSAAKKNLQRTLSAMSLSALENLEFNQREHASLTVACDAKLLPEIKSKMRQFRLELDKFIASQGQAREVYQLTMAFFPLTQNPEKK